MKQIITSNFALSVNDFNTIKNLSLEEDIIVSVVTSLGQITNYYLSNNSLHIIHI